MCGIKYVEVKAVQPTRLRELWVSGRGHASCRSVPRIIQLGFLCGPESCPRPDEEVPTEAGLGCTGSPRGCFATLSRASLLQFGVISTDQKVVPGTYSP